MILKLHGLVLGKFKTRKGLQQIVLHREGGGVDKKF